MANVDKEAPSSNPMLVVEKLEGEVSSAVAVRTVIDLEEEPAAVTDTDLLG